MSCPVCTSLEDVIRIEAESKNSGGGSSLKFARCLALCKLLLPACHAIRDLSEVSKRHLFLIAAGLKVALAKKDVGCVFAATEALRRFYLHPSNGRWNATRDACWKDFVKAGGRFDA